MARKAAGVETQRASRPAYRATTRVWSRVLEVVLLAIAGVSLVILVTQDLSLVTEWLFAPPVIILIVVVFIEYLIIKGSDRSRLYQIEIERMREREQAHVARTRKALAEIENALERGSQPSPDRNKGDSAAAVPPEIEETLRRIDRILRPDLKE